ncbi:MAG: hypothetical protein HN544_00710 [Euryarchaeota archaeon]|nr:hypothetical protein [Euryarchaeota archaeon]
MAKKLFYLEELNGCWSTARDKGIEYAQARGHSPNSLHNDRKDMLYVGCEMQDIGCFDVINDFHGFIIFTLHSALSHVVGHICVFLRR